MTATVVLVQHAEQVAAPGDPGLTDRGRRQAACVAVELATLGPAAVVSSPLMRARRTAQPLAASVGLSVEVDDRLRERSNYEQGDDWGRFVADWRRSTGDRSWRRPGGRSSHETARDLLAAVEEHAVPDRVVVLVTHGGATVDLLRTLLGDEELQRRAPALIERSVPSAAATVLVRADGRSWLAAGIGVVPR